MIKKALIGKSTDFVEGKGRAIFVSGKEFAVFRFQGKLGCIGNKCLHSGGPLSIGEVKDGRVYCPWHNWDWDFQTGGGFGEESVGGYQVWEEDGKVYVDFDQILSAEHESPVHDAIKVEPQKHMDGKIRVLGISTTNMNLAAPRASTSEYVLEEALKAYQEPEYETKVIKLRELKITECEGYYSKDKNACIWPCSITQLDVKDEMLAVYRGLVEWCDVVVVATPIRWGCASSLYYKMQERLNCLQNQTVINDRVLIKDKAACFIITGGQDNVQSVAGQMMMFFAEIGFVFGQFPFVGWTRGWDNEDMKTNFTDVQKSNLDVRAKEMIDRAIDEVKLHRK